MNSFKLNLITWIPNRLFTYDVCIPTNVFIKLLDTYDDGDSFVNKYFGNVMDNKIVIEFKNKDDDSLMYMSFWDGYSNIGNGVHFYEDITKPENAYRVVLPK